MEVMAIIRMPFTVIPAPQQLRIILWMVEREEPLHIVFIQEPMSRLPRHMLKTINSTQQAAAITDFMKRMTRMNRQCLSIMNLYRLLASSIKISRVAPLIMKLPSTLLMLWMRMATILQTQYTEIIKLRLLLGAVFVLHLSGIRSDELFLAGAFPAAPGPVFPFLFGNGEDDFVALL